MDKSKNRITEAELDAALQSMRERYEAVPEETAAIEEELALAALMADLTQLYLQIPSFEHRQVWAEQVRQAALSSVSMHLEPEPENSPKNR